MAAMRIRIEMIPFTPVHHPLRGLPGIACRSDRELGLPLLQLVSFLFVPTRHTVTWNRNPP